MCNKLTLMTLAEKRMFKNIVDLNLTGQTMFIHILEPHHRKMFFRDVCEQKVSEVEQSDMDLC